MKDKNLVIMIDDDHDDHEIFDIALAQLEKPLRLLTFSDCEHAISHFQNSDVDGPAFVFMDLTLPRINGGECLIELKKLSEFDHSCIVIYSSAVSPEWHARLDEIGVDKYLEKSGSLQFLVEQLRDLMIA